MNAEVKGLQEVFEEIVSISSDDGFTFSFERIEPLSKPHLEYPGYRTILKATFAKMKDKIHVDLVAASVNATVRIIEHSIFVKDFIDRCASTHGINLTEHVVEIAKQQRR